MSESQAIAKGFVPAEGGPFYDEDLKNAKEPVKVGPGRDAEGNPLPENSGVEIIPERKGPGYDENGNPLPENSGVEIAPERKGPGVE